MTMVERAVAAALKRGGSLEDQHEAALLAALDAEDEALARIAGKALYDSAANRAGRHRPDLDMRPFEQQSDDMQRAWTEDGAAVIKALRSLAQGA